MSEETLFHEALAKPASERAAFLDAACAGQPQLRAAVEAQLAARAATTDYHPTVGPGLVIAGRYTLMEKIGEGGMGEIWVAKQTEPVKRKAALKLIKTGMDSKAVLARFEQERQALALMDHPHIARVLDGGLTPTGQPFFVMELVNGLPLTRFCDETRLTPRQRLELFVPICQAVQHAHQKGIVHRDLKPANILVTLIDGKPVPKVIDFGVAKATAGKLTDESLSTQFGAVIGTLEYMAPEQAGYAGADIDTRADIYSLGVILYELLTGLRPLDAKRFRRAALTELVRIIREGEPEKPSARLSTEESLPSLAALRQTEPKKLMALLRGELDWVVMKCLEKQRDRRYETANGLARDIQRYLADEPVEARSPSARYRLGKFLRRNKGPVLAASLVLLALIAGMLGTTLGMLHAERARGREAEQRSKAEYARDRTRQALDDMTSSVTGHSLFSQKALSGEQKKFLTEVLTYYGEFAGEKADDEQSRARTAAAAYRVGIIQRRLGHANEAVAAYSQARSGYEALAAEFPAVPAYRKGLADSHLNLGVVLADPGKRTEAEEHFRQALALSEKLAADFPAVPDYRKDLAACHNNMGNLRVGLGKLAKAEQQYGKALNLLEKLTTEFPSVPEYRRGLASGHHNLGMVLNSLGKLAEAEQHYRKALEFKEKLAADFPAEHELRNDLVISHNNLGALLVERGKHRGAKQQYLKALALLEKLTADFPTVPEYRKGLSLSHNHLGILLISLGKQTEAEQQFLQALNLLEKLTADFPAVPEYRLQLAGSHNRLATLLAELGKHARAKQQYSKALTLLKKLAADFPAAPEYRKGLASSHNGLGILLQNLGRPAEAEQQYRKALELHEKLTADFPGVAEHCQSLAGSHNNLGILLAGVGKQTEAEKEYRKGLAIQEQLTADFPAVLEYQIDLGGSYCNLSNLVRDSNRHRESLIWYQKAIRALTVLSEQHPQLVVAKHFLRNSHAGRAEAYTRLQKYAEAIKDWNRAIELSPRAEQTSLRANRAMARVQAGQVAEAVSELAELTKWSNWNAGQSYDFACVYAVASSKSVKKKQEYAERAMQLLHQAVKAGYSDAAHMSKDSDLDSLRERDDFKRLMQQLANGRRRPTGEAGKDKQP